MRDIRERIERIVEVLDEKKGEEIEVFDLQDSDYIAKEVVMVSSLGGRHTQALLDHLKETLKPEGEEFISTDESDEWIVVDLGDIIIHIMTPQYRRRYDIEHFLQEIARKEAE